RPSNRLCANTNGRKRQDQSERQDTSRSGDEVPYHAREDTTQSNHEWSRLVGARRRFAPSGDLENTRRKADRPRWTCLVKTRRGRSYARACRRRKWKREA